MKRIHGGDIYSFNKKLLDFSVNINPLGVPKGVYDTLLNNPEVLINYPDTRCEKLKNALAKKENVSVENIICGNGASEIIFGLAEAVKPKKVLLISPTFSEYEQALFNSEIVYYNLDEENNFAISSDILDMLKGVDMAFICNPNNPTGQLTESSVLLKMLWVAEKYNVVLVIDECFIDFTSGNNSMVDKISEYKNLFIIKAFTKIYSLAGVRLGYGISSNRELLLNMECHRQPWSVSSIAQLAGLEALKEKAFIEDTKAYVLRERVYLFNELERLNIKAYNSDANFILLKSCLDLYNRLLDYNILIRHCENFKGLDKNYYRIAVKAHDENQMLIKALKTITEVK